MLFFRFKLSMDEMCVALKRVVSSCSCSRLFEALCCRCFSSVTLVGELLKMCNVSSALSALLFSSRVRFRAPMLFVVCRARSGDGKVVNRLLHWPLFEEVLKSTRVLFPMIFFVPSESGKVHCNLQLESEGKEGNFSFFFFLWPYSITRGISRSAPESSGNFKLL